MIYCFHGSINLMVHFKDTNESLSKNSLPLNLFLLDTKMTPHSVNVTLTAICQVISQASHYSLSCRVIFVSRVLHGVSLYLSLPMC